MEEVAWFSTCGKYEKLRTMYHLEYIILHKNRHLAAYEYMIHDQNHTFFLSSPPHRFLPENSEDVDNDDDGDDDE